MSRTKEIPFPFGIVSREGSHFAVVIFDGIGPSPEMDTTFDAQVVPGMDNYKTTAGAKRGLTAKLRRGDTELLRESQ